VLEAELGTDRDNVGNPVSIGDAMLGVEGLISGSLTAQIIQEIITDRDVVAILEFLLQVVHSGPFRGEAPN
jgi:hypothetical protein